MRREGEYDHLDRETVGCFKSRRGADGRKDREEGPLDYLNFCVADTIEIGGTERGFPNRITIAAYTGDVTYLTQHGNRDPSSWAKKLAASRWTLNGAPG